ncbi:MAG: CDP-alcohol phosphatidyltransferase family protein [Pseudomonadota bacterium]
MIWTIPNILTIGRLIAAPCIALVFVAFERPLADWLAFCIFVGAAITDFFDGWLARKLDQVSELGKMLDPIADKAMVVIALIAVFFRDTGRPIVDAGEVQWREINEYTVWLIVPAILIAYREVFVSGVREFLGDIKLPVTTLAKLKTTVQMLAIGLLFSVEPFRAMIPETGLRSADYPAALGSVDWATNVLLIGTIALWIAAILTIATGWDYFRKALRHLNEREAT